jgi:lysophospholipase L1-like esterase
MARQRLKLTLALFLSAFFGFAVWPAARIARSHLISQKDSPFTDFATHDQFMNWSKTHHADVLFLGDSLTYFWRLAPGLFAERFPSAVNFGIGGDTIEGVLRRVEAGEVDAVNPKVVVLLVGANNLWSDRPDQIVEKISHLISVIKTKQAGASILLLGLLPTDVPGPYAPAMIRQINSCLAKLPGVTFLDFGPKLLNLDGSINESIQPDHLHLSPVGYRIWADAMGPVLSGLREGKSAQ